MILRMQRYVTLEKAVGETPLSCAENYRASQPQLAGVPMSYAGRLDPMASGKLLVLLGDECKNQTAYHGLDKAYNFSILFGIESDSLDVLGRLTTDQKTHEAETNLTNLTDSLQRINTKLTGDIELPYPRFSAKTVRGKPLHMWTLEGRLDEIEIPTKQSIIYALNLESIETKTRTDLCAEARVKIDTIPAVTDERKALGNDFRRVDVRADWERIAADDSLPAHYQIAHFSCIASSGTYMRTLASVIGQQLGTVGLAWSIHRTHIGTFNPLTQIWSQEF